jgi:hypothetical protein
MQAAHKDAAVQPQGELDPASALWLLGSLANFYRRPFDAALVLQRFAPPFDIPSLIEALQALGLEAGLTQWPEQDWSDKKPSIESSRLGNSAPTFTETHALLWTLASAP